MLTYNREKLVGRAVESVLSQTFTDFEFLIVNNGSTDHSGIIVDTYEKMDSRIEVIHQLRGNIGSGRNTGLDAAVGKYIAFIDDDDWCEPDFLEFLYYLTRENKADVSICGSWDKVYNKKMVMPAEDALLELLLGKYYSNHFPTKMFKRKLAKNLRFPEEGKYDDIASIYKLLAIADRVAYHGLPKYTFEKHPGNNSAWTTDHRLITGDILNEYLTVFRERTERLTAAFPLKASDWRYFMWSFMISMVEKINRLEIKGCEKQLDYMIRELITNQKEFYSGGRTESLERLWMEQYVLEKMVG